MPFPTAQAHGALRSSILVFVQGNGTIPRAVVLGGIATFFVLACGQAPLSSPAKVDAGEAEAGTCGQTMCGIQCVDLRTDNRHCGSCDTPCSTRSPSIAECTAGRCVVTLDYSRSDPWKIAVDETNVYWLYLEGGLVMSIPIEGGTSTQLAASGGQGDGLAVTGADVYWTDFLFGLVMRVPRTGGTVVTLASGDLSYYASAIAVNATSVYWTNSGGMNSDGTIMGMSMAGGQPTTLATGQSFPQGIALDAANVYWINDGGAVMKMSLQGGSPILLSAQDSQVPRDIAVDDTYVYWTESTAGTVMRVPIAGGAATSLVSGAGEPYGLALDDTHVYWTDAQAGTVMKLPKNGGAPITLVANQVRPFAVAVDATSVYWTNHGDRSVMMLRPK